MLQEASLDPYSFLRDSYLQRRHSEAESDSARDAIEGYRALESEFESLSRHLAEVRRRREAGLPRFEGDQPPFYMGKCMTWDFNGPVVARVAPQFIGWARPARKPAAGG